ncbi:MAG: biotin carboxylase [Microthrixaceae bacterium]|nr:biotin carboxylase [Microthrixaceae bacterium]
MSLPSWPKSSSRPVPPSMTSLPPPAHTTSSPPPARMSSKLGPPRITSDPLVPLIWFAPTPGSSKAMVTGRPLQVRPASCAPTTAAGATPDPAATSANAANDVPSRPLIASASRRSGPAAMAWSAHRRLAAAPSRPIRQTRAVTTRDEPFAGDQEVVTVPCPLAGTVVSVEVVAGAAVTGATVVAVVESMKMEHPVPAGAAGAVVEVVAAPGDLIHAGDPLLRLAIGAAAAAPATPVEAPAAPGGPVGERADLAEVRERQRLATDDAARPAAVARRHERGHRTARENLVDLVDPGSFEEYGSLVLAAQRSRRPLDELIERTPADGLVGGLARVNGDRFPDAAARCAVVSYDYMVLAGTQGQKNHVKKDRLFDLVERLRLPVVLFAEGGGGRPGDTDSPVVAGLDCLAFALFGSLSGLVPLVGVVSGRCFAGNAALLGCCDVIIATEDANIGMGGPAMIEGGGLGTFAPEAIGPVSVQAPNGVIDVVVTDEAEAVAVAKRYLSYFQGPVHDWACADQDGLRELIPENRRRVYDVRAVLETLADTDSVLELRRAFGPTMVTALVRIEGRPVGVVANDPGHLGGAIDRDGADKAARFLQLCDAHDLPVLFLCDTPGFLVGPEAEEQAQVRHFSRLFVAGGALTVPFFTVVTRKGYGLGAQAMAGGSFRRPLFTVAWPTGELGGMNLEGAVRLGFRRELDAIADPAERDAAYEDLVARAYEHGKALNLASHFEIDDVIDPADTRRRIVNTLRAVPPPSPRTTRKHPVDPW